MKIANPTIGNQHIAKSVLTKDLTVPSSDGSKHPALRIESRVKLGMKSSIKKSFSNVILQDELTIGQVQKRLKDSSHKCCFMIALPSGVSPSDKDRQTASLKSSFMDYFIEKKAVGSLVVKSNSSSW